MKNCRWLTGGTKSSAGEVLKRYTDGETVVRLLWVFFTRALQRFESRFWCVSTEAGKFQLRWNIHTAYHFVDVPPTAEIARKGDVSCHRSIHNADELRVKVSVKAAPFEYIRDARTRDLLGVLSRVVWGKPVPPRREREKHVTCCLLSTNRCKLLDCCDNVSSTVWTLIDHLELKSVVWSSV